MYGDGLWDDIKSGARRAFKAVQSSDTVRNLEKGLVEKGADVLRKGAEAASTHSQWTNSLAVQRSC